jgi:hypothetical protein
VFALLRKDTNLGSRQAKEKIRKRPAEVDVREVDAVAGLQAVAPAGL